MQIRLYVVVEITVLQRMASPQCSVGAHDILIGLLHGEELVDGPWRSHILLDEHDVADAVGLQAAEVVAADDAMTIQLGKPFAHLTAQFGAYEQIQLLLVGSFKGTLGLAALVDVQCVVGALG